MFNLRFPKQYGAWAMLINAFIVGLAAGGVSRAGFLWLGFVILVFIIQHSLAIYFRKLQTTNSIVKFLFTWPVSRTLAGELTQVWILSLVAPTTAYVTSGQLGLREFFAFLLCAIYFSIRVFRVRHLTRELKLGGPAIRRQGFRELIYGAMFTLAAAVVFLK